MLPDLTPDGELPPGVHVTDWRGFESRFGASSPRRLWLSGRLRTIVELAASGGHLRRIFVWGSFVSAKPAPKDLDILLIMDEDFEVERMSAATQSVFDSTRAKLLFESDVFWARASIGLEMLDLWLDYLPTLKKLWKTRYCGTDAAMIRTDEEMLLAQQYVSNLRRILVEARKVHSGRDYIRMAEPVLLEIQQREQEILEYLSTGMEQPIAS